MYSYIQLTWIFRIGFSAFVNVHCILHAANIFDYLFNINDRFILPNTEFCSLQYELLSVFSEFTNELGGRLASSLMLM